MGSSKCISGKCVTKPDFTAQTLQEHAEAVNQSLGALPRGAIENKYVWAVKGGGATDPLSTPVDQLEYRLDEQIIPDGCQGVSATGTAANVQYGLCLFIQIENPGVQKALKVQYFYNPTLNSDRNEKDLITNVVSGETSGDHALRINAAGTAVVPDKAINLVTVQDLQEDRVWNPNDGDVSKLFISEDVTVLDMCSKRGLCDYDTGMCDCFSGYSGIRCDD